ncbi:hypothetical protein SAMN04488542_12416 [Fontibacillus panacisegetis]|uniref:Uncharacterized protein n=1 Tax=Fontibacillus panacisegetis TaxID=670482 RepID=A0A1G7R046_9BACL|nr:hypothetical protein [Fontibacillus panacisegetis]SDG03509.1 hypothetical protein SAMN04488542_12416 [Fontibacillus panacisegetis]
MNRKKRNRKWIMIPLCLGLAVSLITPGAVGFAEEIVGNFQEMTLGSAPSTEHIVQVPNLEDKVLEDQVDNSHLEAFKEFRTTEEVVHESVEIQPQVNSSIAKSLTVDVQNKDLFQLTQEQMEDLIMKGYSIEDLYQLDELANKILIDPLTIAERKEGSDQSWAELESVLTKEIEANQLSSLSKEYQEQYSQLSKEKLTDHEKLVLLISYDLGKGSITELLDAYRDGGEKGVVTFKSKATVQAQSKNSKSSKTAVDPDVLERIQALAKETGISESELLEQLQVAKEASKQALVEKE